MTCRQGNFGGRALSKSDNYKNSVNLELLRSFHACSAIFSKILHECRARYITSVYVFRRSTLCKFNLTTAKPVWAVCIRPDCPHHARSTQQHDRVMHVHTSRDHLPVFGFGRKDRRKCTLMDKFFIRVHVIIPLFFRCLASTAVLSGS